MGLNRRGATSGADEEHSFEAIPLGSVPVEIAWHFICSAQRYGVADLAICESPRNGRFCGRIGHRVKRPWAKSDEACSTGAERIECGLSRCAKAGGPENYILYMNVI